ncbi:MAG: SH3 domain-containing protein [Treponema sp.]|jgi:hypothetical protein|nr:SH3 domain-containing protein [Treponema sp.]
MSYAQETAPVKPPASYDIVLTPNEKYQFTRQMYLFSSQEVTPDVNEYLKIGAVVTYLKSGEILEDNKLLAPWVYVRSEKGKEGWCFAHYLKKLA